MRTIINYINQNKNIKSIALILENENTFDEIANIFLLGTLERIYIYSSKIEYLCQFKKKCYELRKNKNVKIPENIFTQTYEYMNGIENKENIEVDAVFFDSNVYYETVNSLASFAPQCLLGRIWETDVDMFATWEKYRTISQHILLENIRKNGALDVINWDRRDYDIELSVVFPVYKVEKYLDKCIETATAWKALYVEFLFVNDGSPDNSVEVIKRYQKKDSRIRIIDKKNGGCASARKKGMEEAAGRYIGFFDPDDFIEPTMYKKLLMAAFKGEYDTSYCGYNKYYENSGQIEKVSDALGYPYCEGTDDEDAIHRLIYGARVAIWRGIYRKEFLEKNNISFYEDLKRFDDLPFKVEVFAKAKSVIAIPEYLYFYRLERPGQDVACDDERLYVHFDIFKHLDQFIGGIKNRKLLDYLQISKVQTHFYALEKIQKKYRREYARRMRADIKMNAGFWRTLVVLRGYIGNELLLPYWSVMLHMNGLYWIWLRRRDKQNRKHENIKKRKIQQLEKIYKK